MRLSIATKVFLGFAAVLVTSGLVSVYGVVLMHRIGQGLTLVSQGYFPLTRAAGSLEAFQKERERSTDRLLEEKDPAQRRDLLKLDRTYFARVVSEKLSRAREQVTAAQREAEAPADKETLSRIDARLGILAERIATEEQAAATLDAMLEAPKAQRAVAPSELPEVQEQIALLKAAERRVDYEIKALLDVIQMQMKGGVSEAEQQERAARWAIIALSLLAMGVGVLITWLARRALAPITELTEAAQRLGRGSPETVAPVPERGGDELSLLAGEFNAMAQRLAARERQLRAQSEALLRSERLATIGRIATQITHEIRNPLSAIGLNAEELGERLREPGTAALPQAAALCDAIVREVDRLAAVTEEYLRFARLPKPQMASADLSEVVRDLLEFTRPELEAGGVRLEALLSPGLPPVHADVGQMRQLVLNLLRNAREAMPAGGALSVSTRVEHFVLPPDRATGSLDPRTSGSPARQNVVVEVRDHGPGIPPERLQRIFDPFFTTKERGTGLGLAVAQEIAQEHGGQLTCASVVGQGTTFALCIPAEAAPAPPLPERAPEVDARPGASLAALPAADLSEPPGESARSPARPGAIASS